MCNKVVTLADAQRAIATDWTTAVNHLGFHPKVSGHKSLLCKDNGSCVPARWAAKDDDD